MFHGSLVPCAERRIIKMEVTRLKKKINSINNWFKKNTKEEEKLFRQGLLAFSIFIIVMIFLKVFGWGIFYW